VVETAGGAQYMWLMTALTSDGYHEGYMSGKGYIEIDQGVTIDQFTIGELKQTPDGYPMYININPVRTGNTAPGCFDYCAEVFDNSYFLQYGIIFDTELNVSDKDCEHIYKCPPGGQCQ